MLKTGRLQRGLVLFFFLYVTVATAGMHLTLKGEVFPVFSWSLFTAVRKDISLPQVEILAIAGESFETPQNFFDLTDTFPAARSRNIRVVKLANRIALAAVRATEPIEPLLQQMERSFLSIGEPVTWRVSLYYVDALDYYEDGEIRGIKPVTAPRRLGEG
ncbi:MAG: hypothetical protein AAF416_02010 [Pseudomonadota bacterium]